MQGRTRREVFAAITAAATVPGLEAQHQHSAELLQIAGVYQPKAFTTAEMAWLAHLTDAIIPRTDSPGASDAGVPAFIDRRAASNSALATQLRKGIALLDAEAVKQFGVRFSVLDGARTTALLTPISTARETEPGRFFALVKDLTIDGYYSSQPGLAQELGWHGNTYLAEFAGCTHPEHQK